MENQTELKWFQKPAGVIIIFLFFFPLGLILMWKNDLWTKQTRLIVTALIAVVLVLAGAGNTKSSQSAKNNNDSLSACDCVDILNVPTKKVGIGMPQPIEHLSNEDFEKYEKCYDAYKGPATAALECADK